MTTNTRPSLKRSEPTAESHPTSSTVARCSEGHHYNTFVNASCPHCRTRALRKTLADLEDSA